MKTFLSTSVYVVTMALGMFRDVERHSGWL